MGRWLSPDWSAKAEPVPYAKLGDPQSLNLYAYLLNNPLAGVDADGHERVQLGQHTDDQIKARTKEITGQLKDKSLSKGDKAALRAERNTLGLEKQGNAEAGAYLAALDKVGQRNGLQLSNLVLTTDPTNDFSSMNLAGNTIAHIINPNTVAFVLGNQGPIYLKSDSMFNEATKGFGFVSAAERNDYGGSVLRHEQDHTAGGDENSAYNVQRKVWQFFKKRCSIRTIHEG